MLESLSKYRLPSHAPDHPLGGFFAEPEGISSSIVSKKLLHLCISQQVRRSFYDVLLSELGVFKSTSCTSWSESFQFSAFHTEIDSHDSTRFLCYIFLDFLKASAAETFRTSGFLGCWLVGLVTF